MVNNNQKNYLQGNVRQQILMNLPGIMSGSTDEKQAHDETLETII
jgi:hypothetical protein